MSPMVTEKINLLMKTGRFSSKETLLEKALNSLLASDLSLKAELAVSLYKKGVVSLWKASEIAGFPLEDFKGYLRSTGVKILTGESSEGEGNKRLTKILKSF